MQNGLDVNLRYLEHVTQAMDKIMEKPKNEYGKPHEVVIGDRIIVQDPERPICLNCGQLLNINGVCKVCGRVKIEPR